MPLPIHIAIACAILPAAAIAQEAPLTEARRLVTSIRLDRMSLEGTQGYVRHMMSDREQDSVSRRQGERFQECVQAADPSAFAGPLSEELARQMSREEIQAALRFFADGVGRRLVDRHPLGWSYMLAGEPMTVGDLSPAEAAELDQFKQTPAGRKLLIEGVWRLGSMARVMGQTSEEFMRACARKAHGRP